MSRTTNSSKDACADVCLILEGTYPYVSGGVSSWTHALIRAQSHLKFTLVTLLADDSNLEEKYEVPDNVVGIQNIVLQRLPQGDRALADEETFFEQLKQRLGELAEAPSLGTLRPVVELIASHRDQLGSQLLLNSESAWRMLQEVYEETFPSESFLDFFWSWRALHGAIFATLLAPLPAARCYHSLCTGYGGFLLSRARIETGKPCLLTEHGIYTNERRIEIASADWLADHQLLDFSQQEKRRNLRDYWIDTFSSYSLICYEACERIVTLYEGNQAFQLKDGAAQERMQVIPNGIHVDKFIDLEHTANPEGPTFALVGRVVPIKDVKTFLRAGAMLRESVPDLQIWILGPKDEDPEYYDECLSVCRYLNIEDCVSFKGQVDLAEYLPQVDVLALTSISEAQPLVILEAGACGVPSIATNVGDCESLLLGRSQEDRDLGPGGSLCPLSDPVAVANAAVAILTDKKFAADLAKAGRLRVQKYYDIKLQNARYRTLYDEMLAIESSGTESQMSTAGV